MTAPPVTPLKERFEVFIRNLAGTEQIDAVLAGPDVPDMKRADYLLANRRIIAEQKSLDVDPEPKLQAFMEQLMEERGFVAYGRVQTNDIFDRLDDGAAQHKNLFLRLTRNIEQIVAYADKQTRDTKQIFDIPKAAGILIVLNDSAYTLYPDVVAHRIGRTMNARLSDGSPRYPHNAVTILIPESHVLDANGPQRQVVIPIIKGPSSPAYPGIENAAQGLVQAWARFNRAPFSAATATQMPTAFRPNRE
jgi:hypothetical protein